MSHETRPAGPEGRAGPAARYVAALVRWRLAVLGAVVAGAVAAGLGLAQLSFTADPRVYFSGDNPERQALEELEAAHGRYSSAVLVLVAKDGSVLTEAALAAIRQATARLGEVDRVVAVRSLATERPDPMSAAPLLPAGGAIDEATLEAARRMVAKGGPTLGLLVSEAGDAAAVSATVAGAEGEAGLVPVARALAAARAELAGRHRGIDFYLTGEAMLEASFVTAILRDLRTLLPFQAAAIAVLLIVGLASVAWALAVMVVLGLAAMAPMGLAGWLGLPVNGVTAGVPAILLGLSIATCLHLIVTYRRERRAGVRAEAAMAASLAANLFPISLATATTVISFLCLNFADAPPFGQLGNLVALGLVTVQALAFALLPIFAVAWPSAGGAGPARLEGAMAAFGRATIRWRHVLALGFAVATALGGVGLSRLTLDDTFAHYFDRTFDFRRSTDLYEDRIAGLTVLHFSLPAGGADGVAEPAYLAGLDRFADWLATQAKVEQAVGYVDAARQIAAVIGVAGPDGLPGDAAAGQSVLALYRQYGEDVLPPGYLVTPEGDRSLVTAVLRHASSRDIRALAAASRAWLATEWPATEMPARAARPAGMALLAANLSQRNGRSMILGTAVALLAVSALMFAVLRSVRLGLISLVPNLVPMVLALGFWGAVFGEATFAATVVSAITFGLVVDGTIHFLSKYRRARRGGMAPGEAIPLSFATVGVALAASGAAVISGFAALSFSGFLVSRELGLLTCLTLAAALFADLLFLPALLALFDREGPEPA